MQRALMDRDPAGGDNLKRQGLLGQVAAADCSMSRAPDSRSAEASLGKMPTTSARRPISRLTRSSGFVERSFDQRTAGKA